MTSDLLPEEDSPIWRAIDLGGGQTCDVRGVLRALSDAGFAIVNAQSPTAAALMALAEAWVAAARNDVGLSETEIPVDRARNAFRAALQARDAEVREAIGPVVERLDPSFSRRPATGKYTLVETARIRRLAALAKKLEG